MLDGTVEIEVEPDLEGRVVVLVRGPLDLQEAAELREVLTRVCEPGCPDVVLDLAGVPFIGSSGIGTIVGTHRQLADQGRTVTLRGVQPRIWRSFVITQLDQILTFEDPPA